MRSAATVALAALLAVQGVHALAQTLDKPDPKTGTWLPGCRAFQHVEPVDRQGAGLCAGAIDALLYIGELLPLDYRFCVPRREVVSAIVEDIDDLRPEADRQDFKGMALAILRHRWPCRE